VSDLFRTRRDKKPRRGVLFGTSLLVQFGLGLQTIQLVRYGYMVEGFAGQRLARLRLLLGAGETRTKVYKEVHRGRAADE
jgi:hypothetical protein